MTVCRPTRRICAADVGEAVAKTAAVQRQLATLVSRFNAADTDRRALQQEVDLLNVRNSSLLVAKDRMVDENQAAASRRSEAARKHCERVAVRIDSVSGVKRQDSVRCCPTFHV